MAGVFLVSLGDGAVWLWYFLLVDGFHPGSRDIRILRAKVERNTCEHLIAWAGACWGVTTGFHPLLARSR